MDLHVGQIQGFFNIPVDNLYASSVMMPYIKASFKNDLVMISPDAGGVPRARAYAKRLESRLAFIDKRRDAPGKAKAMHIIGEVKDMEAVILDDIIDTGGTLTEAAKVLMEKGAKSVHSCWNSSGTVRSGGGPDFGISFKTSRGQRHHSFARQCQAGG